MAYITISRYKSRKLLYLIQKENATINIHIYSCTPDSYELVQYRLYDGRVLQHQIKPLSDLESTIKSFRYNKFNILKK